LSNTSVWGNTFTNTELPVQPAPVEGFVKEQKKNVDDTKVGKVENKVGEVLTSAIEKGKKGNLFVRTGTNVAMAAMELANRVIQPVTQTVSAIALTPQAIARGKGLNSFVYAKQRSKDISMGQAVASEVGKLVNDMLPDAVTPTFLDNDFDVFDDKQRNKAFKDEWLGIIASGSTDLAIALAATKGAGTAVRAGTKKVVGPGVIRTATDDAAFKNNLKLATEWGNKADGSAAPSGLAVLMKDAVDETNLTRLSANPLVAETANPVRTAQIVSRLKTYDDVSDYLLAERGDAAAFSRFMGRRPIEADHIDNFGMRYDPLDDWGKIAEENLTPNLTNRYKRIIDAKKAEDRTFARALEDFASKTAAGAREDFVPGKFAAYETVALAKNKLITAAKFGDAQLFGKAGDGSWKTQVYQSGPYDRVIRFIAYQGSGRPQGHINISNPRRFEAANDLLSDLNRLSFLRGTEGSQFKRDMVERYLAADTDTARAVALANIEERVFLELGRRYGVDELIDIANPNTALENKAIIAQITKWVSGKNETRQTLKKYVVDNGMIPGDDGAINLVNNFIDLSNEAQTIPMLDFRRLENEIILHMKKEGSDYVTKGQVRGAYASQTAMSLASFFDVANMVFSNLNLLRIAYIPKNSIVDPMMRASMATESLGMFGNANQGVRNAIYNNSIRAENISRFIPGMPGFKARRQENSVIEQIRTISRDKKFPMHIAQWEKDKVAVVAAEKAWQKARAAQERAAAAAKKASKANQALADDALHAADDALFEADTAFREATDAVESSARIVQGIASIIDKQKAKIAPAILARGDRAQMKRLGQVAEEWEIDGKTYTIKGLMDPNQRGATAYMSEVDTVENFYSVGTRSEINARIKAESRRFVTIDRTDTEAYFNALTHIANRQVRNSLELPLGMIFRGVNDTEILNWIYKSGDAGREWRRRMSDRGVNTQEDMLDWISETSAKVRAMYPTQEVRDLIMRRPVSVDEMRVLLEKNPDLPQRIQGPNINLNDLNKYDRVAARVGGVTDAAWRFLADAETKMVRAPLFKKHWEEELRALITNSRRTGGDPTDYFVNNQLNEIARRRALARVEQTLYSSRRLTNGMYQARYAMSFPLAFFNSQVVALRLMAKNPMNAYWYAQVQQAFDSFEAYEDEEGNTYKSIMDVPAGTPVTVRFPLYNKLPKGVKGALAPFVDERGGGMKVNPKQLEFMLSDPSISWIGGATLSSLINNSFGINTPWKIYGEELEQGLRTAFGDEFYETSLLYGGYPAEGGNLLTTMAGAVLPSYQQSLFKAFGWDKSDRYWDGVYSSYKVAMNDWYRNGQVGEPPSMSDAAKSEGIVNFIRAFVQFNMPISVTFDPVTRAATEYYSKLVEENQGDYDAADAAFRKEWGVDGIILVGSNRKNVANLSASYTDIKVIRDNPELLEKIARTNMKYANMLSTQYGEELTNTYSSTVASIYKYLNFPGKGGTKITREKTEEEIQQDVEANIGWAEYNAASQERDARMYELGILSTYDPRYELSGIQDDFKEREEYIATKYPGWQNSRPKPKDFYKEVFPVIQVILKDEKWMAHASKVNTKWDEIAIWAAQAAKFHTMYEEAGSSEARKYDLRAGFSQFHYDFIQNASDEFGVFAARYLSSMPELDISLVIRR
jgi:hypothetical protein